MRLRNLDLFGSLDPPRCDLKCPSQHDCYRKTDDDQNNDQPNCPRWSVEHGKYLSDALRQSPASDDISDGNLVNIAPLQLRKERRLPAHRSPGAGNWTPSFWHKATKRGSSRYSKTKGVITSWVRPESWVA